MVSTAFRYDDIYKLYDDVQWLMAINGLVR